MQESVEATPLLYARNVASTKLCHFLFLLPE